MGLRRVGFEVLGVCEIERRLYGGRGASPGRPSAACMAVEVRRLGDRAPPARRIASFARSYVCFGPIIPEESARERLGAWLAIASYKHNGRARLSQALLARNKRRSERSSRCAARAALDLTGAEPLKPNTPTQNPTALHPAPGQYNQQSNPRWPGWYTSAV